MKRSFSQLFKCSALWCCRDRTPFVSLHDVHTIRSLDLSLRVCQGLGADFRRKSEIRKPALVGKESWN